MATTSEKNKETGEQKGGGTRDSGEGLDTSRSTPSTAQGPSGNENWTGSEEKLYPGSGSKSPLRPVAGGSSNAAEELWANTQQAVTDEFKDVKDRTKQFKEDMMGRAKEVVSDISDRASGAAETVTTAVKDNPMQSLLIGFGIGCLVGILVARIARR